MDLRFIRTCTIVCSLAASALECAPARAGDETPLSTDRIAMGLMRPIGVMAPAGDEERVFVLEKHGRIRVVENGVLLATPFLDINGIVGGGNTANDERGLLGLAFHPDYFENGFFYINYTNNSSDTTIARYAVSANPNLANSGSAMILMVIDQPEQNHNGGWIDFSPNDGYLYIAMGDGGGGNDQHPFPGNGQNLNNLLGAMLRIDVDKGNPYAIPPDNPFVGVTGDDEIWAYGLRNPWRNAFDSENGDLYIADVGQGAREEVNYQLGTSAGGENYGWRCMEGTLCTGLSGCTCNSPALILPIHTYSHGGNPFRCSISGGEVYRGCAIADLTGTYFFADYCSEQIWSIRVDDQGTAAEFHDRTAELKPPGLTIDEITSFGRDGLGEIYICDQGSSSANGEIFKIVKRDGTNDCTPEPCPADLDGDGTVGASDLAMLLGAWGPNPGHPADFNGDNIVDAADLAQLLGTWGPCP